MCVDQLHGFDERCSADEAPTFPFGFVVLSDLAELDTRLWKAHRHGNEDSVRVSVHLCYLTHMIDFDSFYYKLDRYGLMNMFRDLFS